MRRVLAALASIGTLLFFVVPVSAQTEERTSPSQLVVHEVDARESTTEVVLLADTYVFDSEQVSVSEGGIETPVRSITTAQDAGLAQEIVFVVDVHSSLAAGGVFESVRDELSASIASLPSGTTVSVVSAGLVPTVVIQPTTNLAEAAQATLDLRKSSSTSLFEGISQAGGLLSSSSSGFKTIVVFSGTVDASELVDPLVAARAVVGRRAQVIAVRYQSGDDRLSSIIDVTGGMTFGTSDFEEVASTVHDAVAAASNRFIVNFEGVSAESARGDVRLRIGNSSVEFSYAGDRLTNSVSALAPVATVSAGGIGVLQNSTGLYLMLGLAVVSIGVAVFAFGSIFAGGETTLEGMMLRYSGEGDSELDEQEQAIVQTALVKRAVEMSESFAKDRGFLVKVEGLLERAKLPLRPGEAMSIYVAVVFFATVFGVVLLGGLYGPIILGALAAFLQISVVQFLAKRRIKQFEAQLPDTLQLMASTLRAGYSLPQGLEAVSHEIADPMGFELRRAMTEARLGRELEECLGGIADRLSSEDFAWVVMAIGIQREVGGNLNELLMTVSDTMIARERLKGEVASLTAEGKISAIMLGGMPPALGVIMYVMNKEYMGVLLHTGRGHALLGAAVVTSLIGFAWMKKVITINV